MQTAEEIGSSSISSMNIGVGGWAYLPIRGGNKLKVCSKLYDFVEVNSSFYKLPALKEATSWRKSVPASFEFTVRVNGFLTHKNHLEPTETNFRNFQRNLKLCRELNARVLHFQFAPDFVVDKKILQNWKDFMNSAPRISNLDGTYPAFAFEIRNRISGSSKETRSFFRDHDIIPVSDASKDSSSSSSIEASSKSKLVYSRLFGHGEHTRWSFDSEELEKIKEKVESIPARKRYVTFHNLTMYEDASRMKDIVKTGRESKPSGKEDSISRVLSLAKVDYPVSKETLIEQVGWRTLDDGSGRKIHVGKVLNDKLSDHQKFADLEDVFNHLEGSESMVSN